MKKKENPWVSLIFNIALPSFILMKMSETLGSERAFFIALSLPLSYGVYDYYKRREFNFIAILGFLSILIKGGLGFMKLDGFWFAVNEAAIPSLLAVACYVSVRIKKPLVGMFMLNENVVDRELLSSKIKEVGKEQEFSKLLDSSTYLLSVSFIVSAVINYVLAIYMLKSPAGSDAFNEELGTMNVVSMPVILVCSSSILVYALWRMLKQINLLTGLTTEEIFKPR